MSTFTLFESLALSKAWHSVMPRCAAVMTTRISASAATHQTVGMMSMGTPAALARVAQYTLSTMRAPTQATPEGSTPARMVQKASRKDSGLLVPQRSSSARLLYLKTPKNWRGELRASPCRSGWLAILDLEAIFGRQAYPEMPGRAVSVAGRRHTAVWPCRHPGGHGAESPSRPGPLQAARRPAGGTGR